MESVVFPAELLQRKEDAEVARLVGGETKLFDTRRKTREGLKAQLGERVLQSDEEIRGLTAQVASKEKQVEWIQQELEGVRDLWAKKLVQFNRVTSLEREQARLEGERGQLVASIAQAKGKISETKIQILQIEQDMRTEVSKDLAEIRAKSAELIEKRVAAEDQLKRIDIRAPQNGMVHQLDVHTVGGVVSAGQQIMLIVPAADKLIVEAKVQPQDIDQVRVGQAAVMRFSNFNSRTTPEINGEVTVVSADVTQDQRTGISYYTVRIAVSPAELARLGEHKLVPGMPVEVSSRPRCAPSCRISCARSRTRSPRRSAKSSAPLTAAQSVAARINSRNLTVLPTTVRIHIRFTLWRVREVRKFNAGVTVAYRAQRRARVFPRLIASIIVRAILAFNARVRTRLSLCRSRFVRCVAIVVTVRVARTDDILFMRRSVRAPIPA